MSKRKIVNIINFLRAVEPREPIDLVEPLANNLETLSSLNLSCTFLLQYDVLESPEMIELLKKYRGDLFEYGGWLEIVQSQVEAAGYLWRGRYSWDWHANVGFSIGYPVEQRKKLIDVYMQKFKEIFGCYPRSMGSWFIDAATLKYLEDAYSVKAACICRDQIGTDGYTLWGGYYNHAYYPSVNNMLCPAQTKQNQINIPVFRMLGSDPIHQYDAGLVNQGEYNPVDWQPVMTLEPLYKTCGGNPDWVDWFLEENFSGACLSFAYTQAGQENSFGWEPVKEGLVYQYYALKKLADEGKIEVETLEHSGTWYQRDYELSATCAQTFLSDWSEKNCKSIWYYSRFYRINLYSENGIYLIRDFQLFDEQYQERYLQTADPLTACQYDTLPFMDGYRFSKGTVRAGIYPAFQQGENWEAGKCLEITAEEISSNTMKVQLQTDIGNLNAEFCEDKIVFHFSANGCLRFAAVTDLVRVLSVEEKQIRLRYNQYDYSLILTQGMVEIVEDSIIIFSSNGSIVFDLSK